MRKRLDWIIGGLVSLALLVGAWWQILPLGVTEVLGFITGAACVWLTVKENIWLWPVSIANNIFFIILFLQAQLYADTMLQVIYIVLEVLGWYWWLHGSENRSELRISKATPLTLAILGILLVLTTFGLTLVLQAINDSAPFLDALTTMLSLTAQYMLTRKLIENWYIWISADIIYIGLYASKGLYLTGGLYVIFLVMCVIGLRDWQRSLKQRIRLTRENKDSLGREVQLHG
jgi:nicotinamide mononucleotide transporter